MLEMFVVAELAMVDEVPSAVNTTTNAMMTPARDFSPFDRLADTIVCADGE